ncbi:hypothetical protein [Streptomyces sp. NPDC093149]|uniref:hypothetical protein n=1 Tax=Streptomyces sp. NPDC093149 TaxID=3366031 RepID=UPI00380FD725
MSDHREALAAHGSDGPVPAAGLYMVNLARLRFSPTGGDRLLRRRSGRAAGEAEPPENRAAAAPGSGQSAGATPLLARETDGELLHLSLPRRRRRAAEAATGGGRNLGRDSARRIVRPVGLHTPVMPQWGGWTSGPVESAEVFARHCPDRPARIGQMRVAAPSGRAPSADPAVLVMLIDGLVPWPAAGHLAVHGGP